jgi:hypothetical protein
MNLARNMMLLMPRGIRLDAPKEAITDGLKKNASSDFMREENK